MKKAILIIFGVLIVNLYCSIVSASAGDELPLKVEKLEPHVTQISNTTPGIYAFIDARFSPSGKYLAIEIADRFFVVSTEKLDESLAALEKSAGHEGDFEGFLPSGKVVYATGRGIFTLEPETGKIETVFSQTAGEIEAGKILSISEMVVLSENFLISGDGEYDMGGFRGDLSRVDLNRRRVAPLRKIDGFVNASLSPGGKYILYEHGGETDNSVDYYDIARNANHPLVRRFRLKSVFPKYEKTDQYPIAWVSAERFLAIVEENDLDEGQARRAGDRIDPKPWLILFDAATGKIVWKKQTAFHFFPPYFGQLSPTEAVAETSDGVYRISLTDGKLRKSSNPAGEAFALSPDKKRFAFFQAGRLFTSSIAGADKKTILELPAGWSEGKAYKGMGTRPSLWSPDAKRLIVFGEKRVLLVQL